MSMDNVTSKNIQEHSWKVFSKEVAYVVNIVNLLIIATGLSIFGIVSNIVNCIVFAKQGFQDTVNITLFAIAISDALACLTLIWIAICFNPLLADASVPFISHEVEFLTGGGPHQMALNITAWLTAFVTFERCVCITFPLKVKAIITTSRTKAIVVIIPILTIIFKIPIHHTTRLGWKFLPERNRTMFGLVFLENSEVIEMINFYVSDFLSLILSFAVVVVCTLILVLGLKQKTKWRQMSSAAINIEETSAKEKKVIKMVIMVAVVFITNYCPSIVILICMANEPEFKAYGKYATNFTVALNTTSIFESLNACMNIFVYYHMSTKYRSSFIEVFGRKGTN